MLYNESKHNISLPTRARPTKDPILALQVYSFSHLHCSHPSTSSLCKKKKEKKKGREGKGLSNMVVNK
jgi:hypothetical protein